MNLHIPRLIAWMLIISGSTGAIFTLFGATLAFSALATFGLVLLFIEVFDY